MNKDVAYLVKIRINDSLTLCRFNQVSRTANLHEVKTLAKGERHGFWKKYHDNGQLSSEGKYKDGKQHGFWKYYYSTGELKSEGFCKDGLWKGFWKAYYRNGQLKSEGVYQNGNVWKYYYENGELAHELTYLV